ncbi:MAG: hypothetical protein WA902_22170 [Thermosynechococcaceae cyanobacterium]
METIRENHFDANDQPINDQSAGGLAICNFETWLLADYQSVAKLLALDVKEIDNLEDSDSTKAILEKAIIASTYLADDSSNQRPLQIRWDLAFKIDLDIVKASCPLGYGTLMQDLAKTARTTQKRIESE